jgi:hypothetical protein
LRDLLNHITSWAEGYLWVPLSLGLIWLFAYVAYWLTGRHPTENVDWIVGLAGNFVKCVLAILLCSIYREATGVWLTKTERLGYPRVSIAQMAHSAVALCVFAYLLSH